MPTAGEVARTYFVLGVEHILLGVDHLLFVLGLLLLVGNWRRLVVTVTAFTVAHSITLAAATLGFVHVPQAPVEAVIALTVCSSPPRSCARPRPRRASPRARRGSWRSCSDCCTDSVSRARCAKSGCRRPTSRSALLFFNVGVEAGQLAFIAVMVAAFAIVSRTGSRWQGRPDGSGGPVAAGEWLRTPLAYLIGCTAAFWTVERVVGFL